MITPSFSLTATERVLPRLALDFTTASLDPRIVFTRVGATATRVNSSGYIETMAADTPRFDYDPVTLICKGLLIEESRTNLLLYSNDFANAYWTKTNGSVGVTPATSPDGTSNAYPFIEASGVLTDQPRLRRDITATATVSVFAKAAGRRWLRINLVTSARDAWFDLQDGVLGTISSGVTATITDMGDGWYRCSATDGSSQVRVQVFISDADGSTAAYTGDGVSGITLYGAQLEAGAFATSYIPTTTTALTRNADVATMTGTDFSDWFNASEGTFAVQWRQLSTAGSANATLTAASDGTAANYITAMSNPTTMRGLVVASSSTQASILTEAVTANTLIKLTLAYKQNSFASAGNGGSVGVDTAGNIPVVNRLNIGSAYNGTAQINGTISNISFYPQRLINSEVQAFSK